MKYAVYHTVEGSAGVCSTAEGWRQGETDELEEALRIAGELARQGSCAYVVRSSDGAVLGPDGTWSGGDANPEDDDKPMNYVLRLPRSMLGEIESLASREGVSPNDLVIQGLTDWLTARRG